MLVKELIHREKYWSPITICGGSTPQTFFSKDYGKYKEDRWRACEEYGDHMVHYFYYSTDYDSRLWKRFRGSRIFKKLFLRINPQRLHIEVYDESCNH